MFPNPNQILNSLVINSAGFLPTIVGATLILIVGIVLANWAKKLVSKIAVATKISQLTKNPAIHDFFENAQVTTKFENILGETAKWLILLYFIINASNYIGLTAVSHLLSGFFTIIPNLVAALIILFLGVVLSGFLEKLVKGSLGASDPSLSRFVGRVVSYTTMTIFILAALSQLGIASFFIQMTYVGFILTLVVALGLGLGLGSKDLFKKILEDWYHKVQK